VPRDVPKRRQAEAELRELEERYRTLVDSVSDSIVVLKGDQAVYHNPAYTRLLGHGARSFLDDVAPEHRAPFHLYYGMRQQDGEAPDLYEVDLVTQTGHRVSMEVRASAVDYQGQRATMLVMRDVTERNHLQGQLVQAQKMESIGRLAGGVAHDFNNLLSAVMGYAQLADMQLRTEGRIDGNYLDEIRNAAERGAQLTSQLLAFSRRQVIEPKVLDLNELITNLDRMLRRLIGEQVELVVLPSSDAGAIRADSGQMEQVITNLVVNARDAMPAGGTLTIQTGKVTVGVEAAVGAGEYATVAVSDTGVGMPAHVVERIFEPFFTTKERGQGTGLGLSTCHGIVQQNGGHITVASQPGEGSTFTIYMPSVNHTPGPAQVPEYPTGMLTGSETVLLVEDEPAVRRLTAEVLLGQGYSVLQASNGVDALRIITSVPEKEIDLLLTDVVMPAMGGGELADRFQASYPDAKVLYMSGYPDARVTESGRLPASARFLQKPVTMSVLAREVRETLDV
jgi:PAS domain S-box-containing protein